jgi:hypothetical protein
MTEQPTSSFSAAVRPPADGQVASNGHGGRPAATPKLAPPPRRRRPAMIALGVALVAAGGLVAAELTVHAGDKAPMLAAAHPLTVGQTVSASDLTRVSVSAGPGVATIPADSADALIGRTVRTAVPAGALLARAEFTASPVPKAGRALVGVGLQPGQLPARSLRPGDSVLVVATPGDRSQSAGAAGGKGSGSRPAPVRARVVDVGKPTTDGTVTVDVTVPSDQGGAVAALASTGRVALVELGRSAR